MFKSIYYSNKIRKTITYNKIKNVINLNKFYINLIMFMNILKDKYVSKSLYYLSLLIISIEFDKTVSLSLFILFSIMGALNNTYLFKSEESPKIIIYNYKISNKYLIYNFFYNLLIYLLETIPFLLVYCWFIKLNVIKIIILSLFLINIKIFINVIYLKIKKVYNEDSPDMYITIINILLSTLTLPIVYFDIDISFLMLIINLMSVPCIIYLINFNYNELANYLYDSNDFSVKEQIKLIETKIKEEKESYKYLNKIFNQRYKKYFYLYTIRSLILFVLLSIIYTEKSNIASQIITNCFFINISYKMNELYYNKCDKYLSKYIDKKIITERIKTLIKCNFLIYIFLMIKYNQFKYLIFIIVLNLLLSNLYITLYYLIKPFTSRKRTIIYYATNIIITTIILFLEYININIVVAYIVAIFLLLICITIRQKYICKVGLDLCYKKNKYSKI